jgi:hypothetical protein
MKRRRKNLCMSGWAYSTLVGDTAGWLGIQQAGWVYSSVTAVMSGWGYSSLTAVMSGWGYSSLTAVMSVWGYSSLLPSPLNFQVVPKWADALLC